MSFTKIIHKILGIMADIQNDFATLNASFRDEYTYQVAKCTQSENPTQETSDAGISWNTKGLDLSMTKTNDAVSVNWYSSSANTSHTISTSAGDDKLLSTARQVLLLTGLDIAHAPAGAENIQYYVFSSEDLVVAETTFSYEDNVYSYRMAATYLCCSQPSQNIYGGSSGLLIQHIIEL